MKKQRVIRLFGIVPLFFLTSCVLFLSSCGLLGGNAQAEADVYSIVAPAHKSYLESDVTMSPDAKQRRFELLDAWRKRIVANGGVVR